MDIDGTGFQEDDHRVAYIFTPSTANLTTSPSTAKSKPTPKGKQPGRPSKRRRLEPSPRSQSQVQTSIAPEGQPPSQFPLLLNGLESPAIAALRENLYNTLWPTIEDRISGVLREANRSVLEGVSAFLRDANSGGGSGAQGGGEGSQAIQPGVRGAISTEKIPAAFIITGADIAGQDLLFSQLGEELCRLENDGKGKARFVRIRSGEAPNLKAVLRKVIREAGSGGDEDEDQMEIDGEGGGKRRRYLDYDLEALYDGLKGEGDDGRRVVVAFQDSEGFDNAVLTEVVKVFWQWRGRIKFEVLFGIATSVELFQARLTKATVRCLRGRQFDVVQADTVLERVVKVGVVGRGAALRLGEGLLRKLVERQREQVGGMRLFIGSLKYAYMCHFWANPLSFLLEELGKTGKEMLQREHLEAVRGLDSFKAHVEEAVELKKREHVVGLLEDDDYLAGWMLKQCQQRERYVLRLLRSLRLLAAVELQNRPFTELYLSALADGIDLLSTESSILDGIKRLSPNEITALIGRLLDAIRNGSPELDLPGWEDDCKALVIALVQIQGEVKDMAERATADGIPLKSRYSAQNKVLRTTVVAQKVQLSQDTATLTDDDKAFTEAINQLAELLSSHTRCEPATSFPLHEAWLYDSNSPYRDVFVPQPGLTFARALSHPHDYLSCACCKADDLNSGTLPTTAILYRLYKEAGALINVADLWSAYLALVGDETEIGLDERTALMHFYRGLAELKAMGFVKHSKKRPDHIAKLKWL